MAACLLLVCFFRCKTISVLILYCLPGNVVENFTAILQQPRLTVLNPVPRWATLMDGLWINGHFFSGGSVVYVLTEMATDIHFDRQDLHAGEGPKEFLIFRLLILWLSLIVVQHLVGVLECRNLRSGATEFDNRILGTAPPPYVDAMYASIPGAKLASDGSYIVPCDTKMNVSMVFACVLHIVTGKPPSSLNVLLYRNKTYPVHPIDSIYPIGIENDQVICRGTFEYAPNSTGAGA